MAGLFPMFVDWGSWLTAALCLADLCKPEQSFDSFTDQPIAPL
jgi:hypothetical protein